MRIVLDTNVLIAALISRGFCHELFEYCALTHELFTSDFILNEVREKLVTKFEYTEEIANEATQLLHSQMISVRPIVLSAPVSRDSDDDNILATAAAGNCDYIITGDKDLLVLREFEEILIVTPREFIDSEKIS
ncbi:MAG: putative toxin-antitoxin system toxin component, PIN family [Pyrinomonadaceae bacterium]|nr:putative toxin-antitoxin system toxin component, PIN family [Pyrinomonadaceae bacterium]